MKEDEIVNEALRALSASDEDTKVPLGNSKRLVSEKFLREHIGITNLKLGEKYDFKYKVVAEWTIDDKGEGCYRFVPLMRTILGKYQYVYFAKYNDGSMKQEKKKRDFYSSTDTLADYIRDWEAYKHPEKYGRFK